MKPEPLQTGQTYHIYNRGNNGENLFRERRNYYYFLNLYNKHIVPIADTYAYCLMPNHFHLLVYIKPAVTLHETRPGRFEGQADIIVQDQNLPGLATNTTRPPSKAFSNLFNAYTKSINRAYGRTGSLFEKPFHRIPVHNATYFWNLIIYIHRNPQHHGFVNDFRDWPFTSYSAIATPQKTTKLARATVVNWFGDEKTFIEAHGTTPHLELEMDWA